MPCLVSPFANVNGSPVSSTSAGLVCSYPFCPAPGAYCVGSGRSHIDGTRAIAEGDISERARHRAEELANDADLRVWLFN